MNGDEFHMKKSVVEEEITIASKLRIVSIETGDNVGVGFVALVQEVDEWQVYKRAHMVGDT